MPETRDLVAEGVTLFYFTYTIVAFLAVAAGLMLLVGRASFGCPGGLRVTDGRPC